MRGRRIFLKKCFWWEGGLQNKPTSRKLYMHFADFFEAGPPVRGPRRPRPSRPAGDRSLFEKQRDPRPCIALLVRGGGEGVLPGKAEEGGTGATHPERTRQARRLDPARESDSVPEEKAGEAEGAFPGPRPGPRRRGLPAPGLPSPSPPLAPPPQRKEGWLEGEKAGRRGRAASGARGRVTGASAAEPPPSRAERCCGFFLQQLQTRPVRGRGACAASGSLRRSDRSPGFCACPLGEKSRDGGRRASGVVRARAFCLSLPSFLRRRRAGALYKLSVFCLWKVSFSGCRADRGRRNTSGRVLIEGLLSFAKRRARLDCGLGCQLPG